MSFREWLPITGRNRVALAFAFLGLLCAVGWNFMPWYVWSYSSAGLEWIPDGRAGAVGWPEVFSPNTYRMAAFRESGLFGFLVPVAFVSIALHALSALLAFCVLSGRADPARSAHFQNQTHRSLWRE